MPECGSGFGKCTLCCSYKQYVCVYVCVYVCMGCGGGGLPLPVHVVKYGVW